MDFVCFSIDPWGQKVSRPQELMRHFARRSDVGRVLYVEPALDFWHLVFAPWQELGNDERRRRWRRAWRGSFEAPPGSSKLDVYTPISFLPFGLEFQTVYRINLFFSHGILRRRLARAFFSDVVLWLCHPFDEPLLTWFKPRQTVCFDWMEAWSKRFKVLGPEKRQEVLSLEHAIIRRADMVITASWRLLEIAKKLNPRTYQVFDGIEPEIFERRERVSLKDVKHPVAGYIGGISDRMDVDLLIELADRMPGWTFVFAGRIYKDRVDLSSLERRPNVLWVTPQDEQHLSDYLADFDVCILPYIPEPLSPPPVQLFTYLALGKPIVASALPEFDVLEGEAVFARDAEAFQKALEDALARDTPEAVARRIGQGRANTWVARTEELMGLFWSMYRRRVLIIPHHPFPEDLRIRLVEIGRHMTQDLDVFVCHWHAAWDRGDWLGRVVACFIDLLRPSRVCRDKDLRIVEVPFLHRPVAWAPRFNAFWIERMAHLLGVHSVINGSYYLFEKSPQARYRYIVDLADIPSHKESAFDRFIEERVAEEIAKADQVTVSSAGLVGYVSSRCRCRPLFVPNGTDFGYFRRFSFDAVASVKSRYHLENKWVISHIGYIGAWVDLDFLIRVFQKVKKAVPEAVLFWVGAAPDLSLFRKRYEDSGVVFTGSVLAEDVAAYFYASDIGVLPNKKSLFQDMAFHIKLIEYGAARKCVLSSDLAEVQRLALPHVTLEPLEEEAWVRRLIDMRQAKWSDAWDAALERYDWPCVLADLKKIL
jgi:glycosyltransferase involved in cell wall biosynthesis